MRTLHGPGWLGCSSSSIALISYHQCWAFHRHFLCCGSQNASQPRRSKHFWARSGKEQAPSSVDLALNENKHDICLCLLQVNHDSYWRGQHTVIVFHLRHNTTLDLPSINDLSDNPRLSVAVAAFTWHKPIGVRSLILL